MTGARLIRTASPAMKSAISRPCAVRTWPQTRRWWTTSLRWMSHRGVVNKGLHHTFLPIHGLIIHGWEINGDESQTYHPIGSDLTLALSPNCQASSGTSEEELLFINRLGPLYLLIMLIYINLPALIFPIICTAQNNLLPRRFVKEHITVLRLLKNYQVCFKKKSMVESRDYIFTVFTRWGPNFKHHSPDSTRSRRRATHQHTWTHVKASRFTVFGSHQQNILSATVATIQITWWIIQLEKWVTMGIVGVKS